MGRELEIRQQIGAACDDPAGRRMLGEQLYCVLGIPGSDKLECFHAFGPRGYHAGRARLNRPDWESGDAPTHIRRRYVSRNVT